MNQVIQILTNQLKNNNPQMFKKYEMLRQSNGNPTAIFNQMINSYTPEQMQKFMTFAKNFGIPDEVLSQVQNGIKS